MKTIESMSLDIYSLSDDEHDIESKPIITIDSTNEPNRHSKLSRHRAPANQQKLPPQSFTQQLTTSYPTSIPSTSTATPLTTKYEHSHHHLHQQQQQHQQTQLMETSLMIVNSSTSASTSSSLHHHQHHHRQEYKPPMPSSSTSTTIQIGPPSPSEIVLSPAKLGQ